MDDKIAVGIIHAVKDVALAVVGAVVFVFGITHSIPITTQAVEYVGIYGMYFGIHVGTSSISAKALATQTGKP